MGGLTRVCGLAVGGDSADRFVDGLDAAGVAVVVAAPVEQERRAGYPVADLGGAGGHGCCAGGIAALVAVVVVGGDHGGRGELLDACADAAHGGRGEWLGAVADALAEVAPVDGDGGWADEWLDDRVPTAGVGAAVDVLLAVLADRAALGLLRRASPSRGQASPSWPRLVPAPLRHERPKHSARALP
jgi:hypothetical protein